MKLVTKISQKKKLLLYYTILLYCQNTYSKLANV